MVDADGDIPGGPDVPADRREAGRETGTLASPAVALEVAIAARAAGDWATTAAIADSVASTWWARSGLPGDEAVQLASLLADAGEEVRAARLLLIRPEGAGGEDGWDAIRRAARGMSVAELDAVDGEAGARSADRTAAAVVQVEIARALALAGRKPEAVELARRLLDQDLVDADRRVVRAILEGDVEPSPEPLRIGAVLSLSGRFARVGEQLRDGIELALAEREASGTAPAVEIVVVDDSSDVARSAELAWLLAEEGVIAVLGPIRSEALEAAAAGRSYAGLVILSPTASSDSGTGPNAVSLWEQTRREAGIGAALGTWLPRRLGLRRLAALHPDDAGGRAGAEAFTRTAREAGAEVVAVRPYEPDSTTFESPITGIVEADPEAVLVLTDAARTVLQIAPQLVYYGLRSRVIAGGENWSEPEVLRQLDPAFSEYRLVATHLDRTEPESGWARFRESYERSYLRGLPDNLLPALGYDAAALALAAIPEDGLGRPGALSRNLRALDRFEGATGVLRIVPADEGMTAGPGNWALDRDVVVRMVVDGGLVEADPAAIAAWAEAAREQEALLEELEEEKRKQEEARERPGGGPLKERG